VTAVHSNRKLTTELNAAVAKVAITAILPILRMCSQSLRGPCKEGEDQAIGFMIGLAFHQRSEAKLNTLAVVRGIGQACGDQLRDGGEDALSGAVTVEYFIEGLEQGFGQKVASLSGKAEA